mmetsp:Transcript_78559/g.243714  ORF Transcript_78559/g.243714 Transcript_78559/m.243714 type:complete len:603 (+) Transcript_78559:3-1811(+)
MIHYDSHKWRSLAQIRGSVLPKAMLWALPSASLAFCLKWLEGRGTLSLEMLDVLTQGDIYSGFTFVLGFSLVFRTSQSYLRYWTAATSVHEMGSEWSDSCASLIAFSSISRRPHHEVLRFRHTIVRLFSLLHAMALEEIASVDDNINLLDVVGLNREKLGVLTTGLAQGRKVQIVLTWIKSYIVQMSDSGLLNVPAPILTRVFQELGAGLVNYHKAQQIVIWPFPFPYTQLNLLLIQIYTIITPLVVSTWGTWSWMCCIFTFVSVTCMIGLDLIASELENPFGDDPNDLPVQELQADINKILTMQLNPVITTPPELMQGAVTDYKDLAASCLNQKYRSLKDRLQRSPSTVKATLSSGTRSDRLQAQLRWCGKAPVEQEVRRLQHWLKCLPSQTQGALGEAVQREQQQEALQTSQRDVFVGTPPEPKYRESPEVPHVHCDPPERLHFPSLPSETSAASSLPLYRKAQPQGSTSFESCSPGGCPPIEEHPWSEFLGALREEFRAHLDSQLELQRRELGALEGVLLRSSQALSPMHRRAATLRSGAGSLLSQADEEAKELDPMPEPERAPWPASMQFPRLRTLGEEEPEWPLPTQPGEEERRVGL